MSQDNPTIGEQIAAFRAEYAERQKAADAWRIDTSGALSDLRADVRGIGERLTRHEEQDKPVHEHVKIIGARVDSLRQDRSKALGLMAGVAGAGGTFGAFLAKLFGGGPT